MSTTTTRSVYVKGILLGIPALVIAAILTPTTDATVVAVTQTGAIFLLFGFITGLVAPSGRWRGGAAVAVPLALLLLISVGFAGQVRSFLVHDAPILLAALVFGALGGVLGAKVRERKARAV